MQIKQFAPTSHKIKAVVYGESGCGKTTFGGTCPKPIFASAEGGLLSIAHLRPAFVEIKSLNDLKELLAFLKKGGHGYESVVIDSITEISEIIKAGIEKKTGKPMQIQDFGTLSKSIREILRDFRDLDMHLVIIAQQKLEKDGDKIEKILPSLNGKSADEIAYFMDVVCYLWTDPSNGERKAITSPSPKLITKDRTGQIRNNTEPDFGVWVEAVKGLALGDQTVLGGTPEESVDSDVEEEPASVPESPKAPEKPATKPKAAAKPKDAMTEAQKQSVRDALDVLAAGLTPEQVAPKLRGSIKTACGKAIDTDLVTFEEITAGLSKEDGRLLSELLTKKADEAVAKAAETFAGDREEPEQGPTTGDVDNDQAMEDELDGKTQTPEAEPATVPAPVPEVPKAPEAPKADLAGKDQLARIHQLCAEIGRDVAETGLTKETTRDEAAAIIRGLIKALNELGQVSPAPAMLASEVPAAPAEPVAPATAPSPIMTADDDAEFERRYQERLKREREAAEASKATAPAPVTASDVSEVFPD